MRNIFKRDKKEYKNTNAVEFRPYDFAKGIPPRITYGNNSYSMIDTKLDHFNDVVLDGSTVADLKDKSNEEIKTIVRSISIANCLEKEAFVKDVIGYVNDIKMAEKMHTTKAMQAF